MSLPSVRAVLLAAAIAAFACLASAARALADPVVMAAGDIACLGCSDMETSNLLVAQRSSAEGLDGVLSLGDNQYPDGSLSDFNRYYNTSWGRVKNLIHPVPGNHDSGSGYYSYFGPAAGPKDKGYYSFDMGAWHLIALNSCYTSCKAGSPQDKWLKADLAAHPAACTLAFWHDMPGIDSTMSALADDLDAAGADLVLGGHDHTWKRGSYKGLSTFTVGTGGADGSGSFGVLKLVLHPNSYDWRFVRVSGKSGDAGSGQCHGASVKPVADPPPPPPPPPASTPEPPSTPGEMAAAAGADGYVKSTSKSSNHNGGATLEVAQGPKPKDPVSRSYLRFDVTGVDGQVTAARLRLQSQRASPAGGDVYRVDGGWTESSLTWDAAPQLADAPVGRIGAVSKGPVDIELDPSVFAAGNGAYAFALAGSDRRGATYSSREGEDAPTLVLAVEPVAVVTPPPPTEAVVAVPPPPPPVQQAPARVARRIARRAACRPAARRTRTRTVQRRGRRTAGARRGRRAEVSTASRKPARPVRPRRSKRVTARCARPAAKRKPTTHKARAPRKAPGRRTTVRGRAASAGGVSYQSFLQRRELRANALTVRSLVCTGLRRRGHWF
jgi:calcineurin-like phosphoesterase family protein